MEKERFEAMQASVEYHHVLNDYRIKKTALDVLEKRYVRKPEIEKRIQELQCKVLEQIDPVQNY